MPGRADPGLHHPKGENAVPLGLRLHGRDAVAAGYASSFAAFPDSEIVNEGKVVEGRGAAHAAQAAA